MTTDIRYGIRLAIIYSLVWFIDLLDASSLNVSAPEIAQFFGVMATNAEWVIVGFLLTMSIGISISGWLGERFGTRKIFILSQITYLLSSLGCGLSFSLTSLIAMRMLQGFAAGMAIPIGMAALMRALPKPMWAKTNACMNLVTLIAPAIGPLFGAYVTNWLNWQWIFFLKIPISLICLVLSLSWVQPERGNAQKPFDWTGFILCSASLIGILWALSEVGRMPNYTIALILLSSCACALLFILWEGRTPTPLIPLNLFKIPSFSYGNIIQSAANTIFLGANFLIALYLQNGLGHDLITTGWIMAAITPGMMCVQPIVGRLYNTLGPLPFIIPGLMLLCFSTWGFAMTDSQTPTYLLGILVFAIGASSSIIQSANVASIFSQLPQEYKRSGSSIYSLFKQLSASFGVALSTFILSAGTDIYSINSEIPPPEIFHYCFIILGIIPALALFCCPYLQQQQELRQN